MVKSNLKNFQWQCMYSHEYFNYLNKAKIVVRVRHFVQVLTLEASSNQLRMYTNGYYYTTKLLSFCTGKKAVTFIVKITNSIIVQFDRMTGNDIIQFCFCLFAA